MAVEQMLSEYQEVDAHTAFTLQNSKLLKVELSEITVQAKLGSMVAYQGEVRFEHAGSGGMKRMLKKAVTGEGAPLMKISGRGEVFLADLAQDVHLLELRDDSITVNGANLLAFDAAIDWDIKKVEGTSGMLAGGFFNMELRGTGWVALVSDGPPVLLAVDEKPTFADPSCAITWSSGVKTDVKVDATLKTLIGKGSGETFQVAFAGSGWVLIQPSEGPVAGMTGASGGGSNQSSQGGALGQLGSLFGK
jgi:uncharacterized protein (AIM24 family)